jgi:hypothetical protein
MFQLHSGNALRALFFCASITIAASATADKMVSDFESCPLGSVSGCSGWSKIGTTSADVVANNFGFPTFGINCLKIGGISGGVDSPAVISLAGEGSGNQPECQVEFDFAAIGTAQRGTMFATLNGSGHSPLAVITLIDRSSGIEVRCLGQGTVRRDLDRSRPHRLKVIIVFTAGESNDVVKIFVDDNLLFTGKSWEALGTEGVDRVTFWPLIGGGGNFLIDNLSVWSDQHVPVGLSTFILE